MRGYFILIITCYLANISRAIAINIQKLMLRLEQIRFEKYAKRA
jgi:hypothetical protein